METIRPGIAKRNPPTVAAAVAGVVVAFAGWGLDSVSWPTQVEGALLVLAIVAAGGLGKFAQRFTWPGWKVDVLRAEVLDHGNDPLA